MTASRTRDRGGAFPLWVVLRPSTRINMKLHLLNNGATHGYRHEERRARSTLEQRQATRSEAPAEAERDLGHPDSPAIGEANPGAGTVQPRHRQQVARLRSGWTPRA